MALIALASGAVSAVSGLFGHDAGPQEWAARRNAEMDQLASLGRWDIIQIIARGGTTPPVPEVNWQQPSNWGDTSKGDRDGRIERPIEIAYAAQLLARRGSVSGYFVAPTVGAAPPTSSHSVGDELQRILTAGLGAVEREAGNRLALAGGAMAESGAQREQRSSLLPMLTPGQLLIAVVILGVAVFLLLRRK